MAARFRVVPAGPDDPEVRACMRRYLEVWGFPLDARSGADRWGRAMDGEDVVAVFGEKVRSGTRDVEITDLYPGPGRKGILGVYACAEVLKRLVDEGAINSVSWVSEAANLRHNQALMRVFGVGPVAHFWRYGGVPAIQHTAASNSDTEPAAAFATGEILVVGCAVLDDAFRRIFGGG